MDACPWDLANMPMSMFTFLRTHGQDTPYPRPEGRTAGTRPGPGGSPFDSVSRPPVCPGTCSQWGSVTPKGTNLVSDITMVALCSRRGC